MQPRHLPVGASATITVHPTGGQPPYTVQSFTIDGQAQTLNAQWQATVTASAPGRHNVSASVRDSLGATAQVSDWFWTRNHEGASHC